MINSGMKTYTVDVYDDGDKHWCLNGKWHREDGPAIERADGSKEWYLNGKLHREDGPAVEWADGSKYWYLNGKLHREDGPAVERADGSKWWYLNGKELTEAEFDALETELAAAKECVAIANRSADDQMHQKREAQTELTRIRDELAKIYSLVAPHGCDLPNGIWETARAVSDLIARAEIAENWSDHHASHADDLIAENVKLRADLERFTGHGLLDCHAICDQRDAAVAERDRLRVEVERLTATLDSVPKLIGDQNDRLARERHEAVARAEKRVERLKELLRIESASAQHALAAAERAEAALAFQVARNSDLFTQRDEAVEAQEKAEAALAGIACQKTHKELAEDETQEVADTADYQGAYDQMIAEARAAIDAATKEETK